MIIITFFCICLFFINLSYLITLKTATLIQQQYKGLLTYTREFFQHSITSVFHTRYGLTRLIFNSNIIWYYRNQTQLYAPDDTPNVLFTRLNWLSSENWKLKTHINRTHTTVRSYVQCVWILRSVYSAINYYISYTY